MKATLALLFICCFMIIPTSDAQFSPTYQKVNCAVEFPFLAEIEGVECGFLTVLENRAKPDGATVELAVVIIESLKATATPPLFYLEGGPGGSAISSVDYWLVSPLRQNHTIVLYDQRGTGFSFPFLGCDELLNLPETASYNRQNEAFKKCRNRLQNKEGIDLAQYNSAASALDIQELRVALGYAEIDLLGVSYGTRLALTVMRDAPQGIRSVILDSVYPPHVNAYEEEVVNAANAILAIIDACMINSACNAKYPDLRPTFYRVVNQLNENPATFRNEDWYGTTYRETLYGDDVIDTLFNALYVHEYIPYIPQMIWELDQRTFETYKIFYNEEYLTAEPLDVPNFDYEVLDEFYDLGDSDGMFYSVECVEEVPFNNENTAYQLAEPVPDALENAMIYSVEDSFSSCDIWNVPSAGAIETQLVQSDIPTLILAGQFDPITPSKWAFSTAEGLPNSYAYEFPGLGHSVMDGGDCPIGMVKAFLNNPTQEPDASCITQMQVVFQ